MHIIPSKVTSPESPAITRRYQSTDDTRGKRIAATLQYRNFILDSVGTSLFMLSWPVNPFIVSDNGKQYEYCKVWRRILGCFCSLIVPASIKRSEIFSVTQELSGKFKVVEFWEEKAHYLTNKPPFAVRCISAMAPDGQWHMAWAALDDKAKLKAYGLSAREISDAYRHVTALGEQQSKTIALEFMPPANLDIMGTPLRMGK